MNQNKKNPENTEVNLIAKLVDKINYSEELILQYKMFFLTIQYMSKLVSDMQKRFKFQFGN